MRIYLLTLLVLPLLACGLQAPTVSPTAQPYTFGKKVAATNTPQSPCYVVLVDTLYLRKGAGEEFAAYDGLELHAGDAFTAKAVWVGAELWYELSPVEFVAGQIGEKVFIGACK